MYVCIVHKHNKSDATLYVELIKITIKMMMMVNFINLFSDKNFFFSKVTKVFIFFMLKQVSHLLFPQHDDSFSYSTGYTFDRNDTIGAGVKTSLTCSSVCKQINFFLINSPKLLNRG